MKWLHSIRAEMIILPIAVFIGLLLGLIDTLLDYWLFYDLPFMEILITNVPKHEIWMRGLILLSFVASGLIISSLFKKRRLVKEALQKSHDELEQQVLQRTSELQKSNEIYQTLVDTIPYGIQEIDTTGVITFGNKAYCTMLGYEPEEILGKYIWDLLCDDAQKDQLKQYFKELVISQPPRASYFQTNLTKLGKPIDVQVDWNYKRDEAGAVLGFVSVITDITERKAAEEKLAAERRLLKKLLNLQEQERKLMAYEIHDGMVQDVVATKMLFEGIVHDSENETLPQNGQIDQIKELLDKAISEGRRLIRELRPMILDEAGIVEAIKHLIASEYSDSSLQVELLLPLKLDRLDAMLEGTVFRIVQEALTNVKRYSKSATAVVKLVQRDQQVVLEIRDQGVGFEPDKVSEEHFGLQGILERARLFGGHATIESAPGQGCCIMVELPVVKRVPVPAGGTESGDHKDQ